MTDRADRVAINRAVAKAIAYHDCGKRNNAALWAAEIVRLLDVAGILTPEAIAAENLTLALDEILHEDEG